MTRPRAPERACVRVKFGGITYIVRRVRAIAVLVRFRFRRWRLGSIVPVGRKELEVAEELEGVS